MSAFGQSLREYRVRAGMSLSRLSDAVHYSKGYLSNVENGRKAPTAELARACDGVLRARGELIAACHLDVAAARDTNPWQTAELLRRLHAYDAAPGTLASLEATVFELCCQYVCRNPAELRAEAQDWLQHVAALLRRPTGLRAHRSLLVSAGWLALLIGCLEYDLGMRASAEATRVAARQLGEEADHSEIVGWTCEMSAWFALTQGRYPDVIANARAGQAAVSDRSVVVQLIGQEAKALARMGSIADLRSTLDRGRRILDQFPEPSRTEHHFIVDPAKWDFYAMDTYRLAGDDDRAERHAREVIAQGTGSDGVELSPMRIAEAQLTLGVVAARKGELELAVAAGLSALAVPRQSLPSLLMVAGELDSELGRRFPGEPATAEFRDALRALR
ncbi:helix-turn-helix transcriptional regulator [Planosporangium flavigriseum]|nr:helix-turn-helix transcriptional regulator [Planosporangium flavigriseum]NJC64694.1 helix-turn-helix transcriptional regulator [Planosporangium flavigriseum]